MTEKHVIEYNVTDAVISKLKDNQSIVLKEYELTGDISLIEKAKKEPSKLRISIEKKRKELKADALAYGRKVDSEAKKYSEPVVSIENKYKDIIDAYELELARVAKEAQDKEDARIAAIENKLNEIKELTIFTYGNIYTSRAMKDVQDRIDLLEKYKSDSFNYEEFEQQFIELVQSSKVELESNLNKAIKYEAEQKALEEQRKKDEAERAKLEAEKADFERKQREAQEKLEAQQRELEKQKQEVERAEYERKQAEIEKQRQLELQKEKEELERQRKIDEQNRIEAEKREAERVAEIEKQEAIRKAKQEREDRVRNAAPELLEALEGLLKCDLRSSLVGGYGYQIELAESAYCTAGGDLEKLLNKGE